MDGEDDEDMLDGEVGGIDKEMVHITHPYSLLFLHILFFPGFVSSWCL